MSITHPEQIIYIVTGGSPRALADVLDSLGTFIPPGSGTTPRPIADKLSDVLSAKDLGAKGDGVTNDGPILAAWISAQGSTPTSIYFPAGVYLTNSNLFFPVNITVRIDSAASFSGSGLLGFNGDVFRYHRIRLADAATAHAVEHMLEMDHFSSTAGAIDIQNYADNGAAPTGGTGADLAFTIHQYSDKTAAMQIDNTRSQPFIRMKEASNSVNSAGTQGNGPYFELWGYTTGSPNANLVIGKLTAQLVFQSFDVSRPFIFEAQGAWASLRINQTNAADSLDIFQSGAGNAINVSQSGASHGVSITALAGADGFYPFISSGRKNGGRFGISQDGVGNNALLVAHDGTGAGDALDILNKGTGSGISVSDGTNNVWWLDKVGKVNVRTGGTADTAGKSVLVGGTVTVATTAVTANSIILLTRQVAGGTVGDLRVGTITAGTSFVISSASGTDTSTVSWLIIN